MKEQVRFRKDLSKGAAGLKWSGPSFTVHSDQPGGIMARGRAEVLKCQDVSKGTRVIRGGEETRQGTKICLYLFHGLASVEEC